LNKISLRHQITLIYSRAKSVKTQLIHCLITSVTVTERGSLLASWK